jgi:hypothetical protein
LEVIPKRSKRNLVIISASNSRAARVRAAKNPVLEALEALADDSEVIRKRSDRLAKDFEVIRKHFDRLPRILKPFGSTLTT